MLRIALQLAALLYCTTSLLHAAALEAQTPAETMIDRVIFISGVIEELCGERIDVVWVDDRGINPPCLMSYSKSCSEAQDQSAHSCEVMMRALKD